MLYSTRPGQSYFLSISVYAKPCFHIGMKVSLSCEQKQNRSMKIIRHYELVFRLGLFFGNEQAGFFSSK